MNAPGQAVALRPAQVWWHAARPATLAASVSPVVAGTAAAWHDGASRAVPALAALGVAVAMQCGVNFANDYSDHRRGADSPQRVGPVRAAASGVVPPRQVLAAAAGSFAAAAVIGTALSLATRPWLIAVGVACVLAGWLYTGGPRPYGYMGLGELFVFVFFGLVATTGTAFVQELRLTPLSLLAAIPMGAVASAVLVLNNIRDIETDRVAGKMTLSVRLGRRGSRGLVVLLLALAFAAPVVAAATRMAGPAVLLSLLAVPLGLAVLRGSGREDAAGLIRALKGAAALELLFALLWAAGLAA